LKKRLRSVFGFSACDMASFAASMSPFSGVHGEFGLKASKPGRPFGENPVEGTWSAWAMLSTIVRRSMARESACRSCTSGRFSRLKP
jgi:hypothetical protein